MCLKKIISVFLLSGIAGFLWAEDQSFQVIESFDHILGWEINLGREFPGAEGRLSLVEEFPDSVAGIFYDFTEGGNYISAWTKNLCLPEISALNLDVWSEHPCRTSLRISDATGRVFQSPPYGVSPEKKNIRFSMSGPWAYVRGGEKSASPKMPLQKLEVMVASPKDGIKTGSFYFDDLSMTVAPDAPAPVPAVDLEPAKFSALGWNVKMRWNTGLWQRPVLEVDAEPVAAGPATLRVRFPLVHKDQISYFELDPKKGRQQISAGPFDMSNPRNIYSVELKLSDKKADFTRKLICRGRLSREVNFGRPMSAKEIGDNRMGTMTLFNYAPTGHHTIKYFSDYERILDLIANAGLTWIRDYATVEKGSDGELHVRPHDMAWIRAAKRRGINIILTIQAWGPHDERGRAQTPEEYAELCRVAALETKGLVDVFEMSNEPQNFGGFQEPDGRTWNGMAEDGGISQWVREYLVLANAGAKAVKEVRPGATVIGLGMAVPTNIRALKELDVAEEMDGVTFHPYTYSITPERIPFTSSLAERDGVRAGDDVGSYEGHVRLQKEADPSRSLWITEFGWTGQSNVPEGNGGGYSDRAHAAYHLRRFIQTLTLPVEANIHYLFLDLGYKQFKPNSGFGFVTKELHPKFTYWAVQRMTSLMSGYEVDPNAQVEILKAELTGRPIKIYQVGWDDASILAEQGVLAYPFANPDKPDERQLVMWSGLPSDEPFNPRGVKFRLDGWSEFDATPIAVDLITGESYDLAMKKDKNGFLFENVDIPASPLVIKFFKDNR